MSKAIDKRPDNAAMRNAIFRLEDFIKSVPGNGIEESGIQHVHHFAPGVYAKEMICPADVYITGMVHKTEHISIFLEGRMIVADGSGGSVEIEAPMIEIGKPGIKRAGYTLEEVRWITVHPTEETDIDKLEQMRTNVLSAPQNSAGEAGATAGYGVNRRRLRDPSLNAARPRGIRYQEL